MKRILSAIIAVVMMLSIAPVANIFVDTDTAITASAASTYYTTTASLNLRKGPSTKYAKILTMPKGAKVKYLGKSGSFYKVSYTKNGKTYTGYASSSYLKKATSSSSSSGSSSGMKAAYKKIINKYDCAYYLFDVNNDGTKELIILTGDCEPDYRFTWFTYSNGVAKQIGKTRATARELAYKGTQLYVLYQGYGCIGYYKISMKNGKISEGSWIKSSNDMESSTYWNISNSFSSFKMLTMNPSF